jgi:hypothetical protein
MKWSAKVLGIGVMFQEKRDLFWKGLCKVLIYNKDFD